MLLRSGSAADSMHAAALRDLFGIFKTVRVRFVIYRILHLLSQQLPHLLFGKLRPKDQPEIFSFVIAEAGLEKSLRCETHTVAAVTEFAMDT